MTESTDETHVPEPDDRAEGDGELTRRRMLKLTVSAALAAPLVNLAGSRSVLARVAAAAASEPRFFTKDEFALLDELTEIVIPADEHSPGARAAQVAAFVDAQLAETWETDQKDSWRAGLKAIEALSQQMNGKAFLEATPDQRVALLTSISKNEFDPKTPEEKFFRQLKTTTAYVYYTSEIGIHKEIGYLGNTYLDEFAGYDVSQEDRGPNKGGER
jgi:hypothetical protein